MQVNVHKTVHEIIGPLHDPVTWYGINYTGTQITQWDFQNKGKSGWTGASSFVLKVPLRNLRPSVIYSVPCDRIVQRAYCGSKFVFMTSNEKKHATGPTATELGYKWCNNAINQSGCKAKSTWLLAIMATCAKRGKGRSLAIFVLLLIGWNSTRCRWLAKVKRVCMTDIFLLVFQISQATCWFHVLIFLPKFSSNTDPKWQLITACSNFAVVVWTENIWWDFSGVEWTEPIHVNKWQQPHVISSARGCCAINLLLIGQWSVLKPTDKSPRNALQPTTKIVYFVLTACTLEFQTMFLFSFRLENLRRE